MQNLIEKCSVYGCDITLKEILYFIDDGEKKVALCPNHSILFALDRLSDLNCYPSSGVVYYCDICGKNAALFKDSNTELHLCKEHLKRLLLQSLTPEEFKKLYALVGNIFYFTKISIL